MCTCTDDATPRGNPSRREFIAQQALVALGLVAAPSILRAASRESARPPNLLFVMGDEWRRQALGFAGQDPVGTPHLDRFASDALVFNQACTTRPICSPNRACMFTGLYPQHHGLYMNGLTPPLNPALPLFPAFLKEQGYRTSYVGKYHFGGRAEERGKIPASHRQVWDNWILAVGHQPFHQPYFVGDASKPTYYDGWAPDYETEQTLDFIRENRHAPFAAVLSWGPPHPGWGKGFEHSFQPGKRNRDGSIAYGLGFEAPVQYEAEYQPYEKLPRRSNVRPIPVPGERGDPTGPMLPGYFGACTALDNSFGRLLEGLRELDQYDNTLIVFTSDHGEMLGSHGRVQKGVYYEEALGVPLLMRLGDRLPARRTDALISTIDLGPTILGLLGVSAHARFDGRDYSGFARGTAPRTTDAVCSSFDAAGPTAKPDMARGRRRAWRSIRTQRYCYALLDETYASSEPNRNRRVLYDLSDDPYEMNPIFGKTHQSVIDDLHGRLARHLEQIGDNFIRTKFVW